MIEKYLETNIKTSQSVADQIGHFFITEGIIPEGLFILAHYKINKKPHLWGVLERVGSEPEDYIFHASVENLGEKYKISFSENLEPEIVDKIYKALAE
jgi:hypothetical protein